MMSLTAVLSFALAASSLASAASSNLRRAQLNAIPKFPYDPSTTKYCAWWLDNDGTWACQDIEDVFGVSMDDFKRWNPSVSLPCDSLATNESFCIAGGVGRQTLGPSRTPLLTSVVTVPVTVPVTVAVPVTQTTVVTATATVQVTVVSLVSVTAAAPTPTRGGNGIATPAPYQPGMVDNCKTFYLVQPGDTCVNIAARYRVSPEQLIAWNPYARADCTRLLANTYCCVGVL